MEKSWEVALLCRIIDVSVMAICMVVKMPQIIAIHKAGTTQGLSFKSLLMEFWCFTTLLAYPCAHGYPVSGYGEFLLLVSQDIVILFMVLKDRNMLSITSSGLFVLFMTHVFSLAMDYYPRWVLYVIMSTVTPMAAFGKILQIYTIVSNKSAGSVSALTWGLGSGTAAARVITLLINTGDKALIFITSQAAILNGLIFLSAFTYKTRKEKVN